MILVGLNGGQRQGKSTVGEELRRLAGVDEKADLEFAYPIGQVVNLWVEQWPLELIESGKDVIDIANALLPLLVSPVKQVTGFDVDPQLLHIEDTPQSRELNNRLLSYLTRYIEAGAARSEEFPMPIGPDNKVLHRACYQWVGARLIDEVDAGEGHDIWTRVLEKRIQTLKDRNYALVTVGGTRYPVQQDMIRRNGGIIVEVERPGMAVDNDVTEQAQARDNYDVKVFNNGTLDELYTKVAQLYDDLRSGQPQKEYRAA